MTKTDRPTATIESYFEGLPDPRVNRTRCYKLIDILIIGICTVICGGDDYESMADFGKAKEKWFQTFLAKPDERRCKA